jgi:hypothetical protein
MKRLIVIAIFVVISAKFESTAGASGLYPLDRDLSTEQLDKNSDPPVLGGGIVDGDVPSYLWHYGCSPTSGGMIVGYWDSKPGYENLFYGDASIESAATRNMIASPAHITSGYENGYTYGDWHNSTSYPNHESNPDCIADFMHTENGGSSAANIASGLEAYVEWDNPATPINESYEATALNIKDAYWGGTFTYDILKTEIDDDRPVLLDLYTYNLSSWHGHSIVAYGYQDDMFSLFPPGGASENIIVPGIAVDDTWKNGTDMCEWLVDADNDNFPESYFTSYIDEFGVEWWPYYTLSDAAGYSYTNYWDWAVSDAVTLNIVPEPATLFLLALGGSFLKKRRRPRQAQIG